jgi:hypothetical protein
MELARQSVFGVNIVVEATIFTWTYPGSTTREVLARVDIGSATNGITGNNVYTLRVYVNNVEGSPESRISVGALSRTLIISREIPLDVGDTLKLTLQGGPGDLSVDVTSSIRDATVLSLSDISGAGNIAVDHNYGGVDVFRYVTSTGAGVEGATILCYDATGYANGNRGSEFVLARSTTGNDGRWLFPMMLTPGTYTLVFSKPGYYLPSVVPLTVT